MSADYSDLFKKFDKEKQDAQRMAEEEKRAHQVWRANAKARLTKHALPAFHEAADAIGAGGFGASVEESIPESPYPCIELRFYPQQESERSSALGSTFTLQAGKDGNVSVRRKIAMRDGSRNAGYGTDDDDRHVEEVTTEWVAAHLERFVTEVLAAQAPK